MKSLQIKNYKNFENLTLNDLGRINLIVGKNNVGKSALLEAVSIFASGGDLECIKSVLESRGEGSTAEYSIENELGVFLSLYRDSDMQAFFNSPIEISANKPNGGVNEKIGFSMRLVKYRESTETDSEGFERPYKKILKDKDYSEIEQTDVQTGLLLEYADRKTLYTFNRTRKKASVETPTPYEYVRTNQIIGDKNPTLFDKIALTPNEKYIVEALQIIEPRIENINFLNDNRVYTSISNTDDRVPFIVFQSSTKRYRLSAMGDGMNRILTIILAMLNCKDGILLIDEFENGLHYSIQHELWKIILRLSEQLNVQVFATTHSLDTLRSLSQLISENPAEEMKKKIACYYLQKTQEDTIKSYRYDAGNFEFLINGGEEIR